MSNIIAECYRNDILESVHRGHVVVMHGNGDTLLELGDPARIIFPRSSCKIIQALPLVESGAAEKYGLKSEQLALACASHNGEMMHTTRVEKWLHELGLDETALRCGPQAPSRTEDKLALHDHGQMPTRVHNNCSGKHAGFLTLNKHLDGSADYQEISHPVQQSFRQVFGELTEEEPAGFGIDGCSAPNFACSVRGLARAAATLSRGGELGGARGQAAKRLIQAQIKHPLLMSGTGRACAELISASGGRAVIKTGAEGCYLGIIPERQIGIAIKCEDGSTRGAETAIAALLARMGVVDQSHPALRKYLTPELRNFADQIVGDIRPGLDIWQGGIAM